MLGRLTAAAIALAAGTTLAMAQAGDTNTKNAPGAGGKAGASTTGPTSGARAPGDTTTGEASPKGGSMKPKRTPGAGGTSGGADH